MFFISCCQGFTDNDISLGIEGITYSKLKKEWDSQKLLIEDKHVCEWELNNEPRHLKFFVVHSFFWFSRFAFQLCA